MVIGRFAGPRFVAAVRRVELADDERVLVLRQVLRHVVIELQLPLVGEHHDGDGGHRLRHRGDVEDRVLRHRRVAQRAALAERLVVEHAVLVDDGDDDAGDVAARSRVGEELRQRSGSCCGNRRRCALSAATKRTGRSQSSRFICRILGRMASEDHADIRGAGAGLRGGRAGRASR